jgi:glycerol transport system permease protein
MRRNAHLIPVITPGISVAAFFCFVFSWIEVVFARILGTGWALW